MKYITLFTLLLLSFSGCINKGKKSMNTAVPATAMTVSGKETAIMNDNAGKTEMVRKDSASSMGNAPEGGPVDQFAGLLIIEALSKLYGNDPNFLGGFIGSPRCPSFLEGMFFDGPKLVFQVRGDTLQARRILEKAAGSKAFQIERMTEANYSQQQLLDIKNEVSRRYEALTDKQLKRNMHGWGVGLRHVNVYLILNTPEARQAFREKIMDSPAIRFEGPEQPIPNDDTGIADTLGISLHPEYSVYSTAASTASFVLLNQGDREIMCGEHYFITYEDERGVWRELPINGAAIDIGYSIFPGGYKLFTASLYPEVHSNKPGRYRFFYHVTLVATRTNFTMMTEFRLTDDKQEVERAVRMKIPPKPDNYGAGYMPIQEELSEENTVYQVVEEMPEFPGGMSALQEYIRDNIHYPETALRDNVQGRVIIQIVIMEDGTPTQVQVTRSIDPRLDEEAIRVIRSMPRWSPGKQQGRTVKVKYTLPVTFKLP